MNETGLTTLVEWYEESVEATTESRRLAERDRDYYDSKQWTPEESATLKKRGQPVITTNRIKPKIDFLLGTEQKQRTDPRAAPRNPVDDDGANAATDAIRFVCDQQSFSSLRSDVFKELCIEGMAGCIVEVKNKGKRIDIVLRRIPWDRAFYDPHSRELNFSDARYLGIIAWMDVEDAVARYGEDKRDLLVATLDHYDGETFGDKPSYWVDSKRDRVKIVEIYYQIAGEWMHCTFTKGGHLVEPAPSEYTDEDGVPVCPIELQSCHVDRQNRRYGLVRQLIGPQDNINKRGSKALHLISMRQVVAERGAVDDVRSVKRELAKPDGFIEVNPGMKFDIVPTTDMASGNLSLLQEAKLEIDTVGANASLTGKEGGANSGRELLARQQGGLTELGPVFDALRQWQQRIYKQIWSRIKQFWAEEMWVRVTDEENNVKFAGLNQPLTAGEQAVEQAKKSGMPPEQLQQLVQQLSQDPRAQEVVGKRNNVAEMDMDIILEDAPDTVNLASEQFEQLAQMYQAAPDKIPFDVIIEASSLRNKKQLLERMRGDPDAQKQEQDKANQEKELAMKIQVEGALGKVEEQSLKNKKLEAEIQEMQAKLPAEVEKLQAEAMKLADGMNSTVDGAMGKVEEQALKNQKLEAELEQMRIKFPVEVEKLQADAMKAVHDMRNTMETALHGVQSAATEARGKQNSDEAMQVLIQGLTAVLQQISAPKRTMLIRDETGRAVGSETVQ